ncbi:hypothetical protein TWF694_008284 [Orbilia ellipsospora]|uniref:Uncharacterized protein n=1 Tax=Orbilia ellipsospora TaxID=2528407 RepID=A0AAV9XGL4_9PEZI
MKRQSYLGFFSMLSFLSFLSISYALPHVADIDKRAVKTNPNKSQKDNPKLKSEPKITKRSLRVNPNKSQTDNPKLKPEPHVSKRLVVNPNKSQKDNIPKPKRPQPREVTGPPPPLPSGFKTLVVKYGGPDCSLGLWAGTDENRFESGLAKWQGNPLKTYNETFDHTCINIKDLNPSFATDTPSSFILTGFCECEFKDALDCGPGNGFLAYNRADGNVDYHGSHPSSFRCYHQVHADQFDHCDVTLYEKDTSTKSYAFQLDLEDFDQDTGSTKCQPFDPLNIVEWGITGCSCVLFTSSDCTGLDKFPVSDLETKGRAAISGGNAGKELYYLNGNITVQSYQCYLPIGVPYDYTKDI